jgi:hypothetical protein
MIPASVSPRGTAGTERGIGREMGTAGIERGIGRELGVTGAGVGKGDMSMHVHPSFPSREGRHVLMREVSRSQAAFIDDLRLTPEYRGAVREIKRGSARTARSQRGAGAREGETEMSMHRVARATERFLQYYGGVTGDLSISSIDLIRYCPDWAGLLARVAGDSGIPPDRLTYDIIHQREVSTIYVGKRY